MAPVVPGKKAEQSMYPKLYMKHELENGVISEFGSIDRIKIIQTIFEGSKVCVSSFLFLACVPLTHLKSSFWNNVTNLVLCFVCRTRNAAE
jgi:hypothetical protein